MKVWVVHHCNINDYAVGVSYVDGVFDSLEKARQYIKEHQDDLDIFDSDFDYAEMTVE